MNPLTTGQLMTDLGRNSLQASALVLAVIVVQWGLGRRLQPRWRCGLWLLVVVRLLIPVSFTSMASLSNIWPLTRRLILILNASGHSSFNQPGVAGVPRSFTASFGSPGLLLSHMNSALPGSLISRTSWAGVIFWIWLAGVVVLLSHILVASLRMSRHCSSLKPLSDPAVLAVLAKCYQRMGMSRLMKKSGFLRVLESVEVTSPSMHGLLRPYLLLPKDFIANFSPEEWRFVFLHELAHLKRRDLWMNWIMALLQVIHWFNPLIWLAFARWRAEREIVCDAMVLEAVGKEERRQYGYTILKLLENFTPSPSTPALVGIVESEHQVSRRIGMIKAYVPTARWSVLAALLLASLSVMGLTDAQVAPTPASDLVIISATYGSGTHFADVTNRVNDLLRNPNIVFYANPGWLQTDPNPWWNKALVIVYEYKGKRNMFATGEGGGVSLSDFRTSDKQ